MDTYRVVWLAECVVLRPAPYQDGSQEMTCVCLLCTGYGLEVDMWAAGVILYILLCGFPPFRSPERDQEELFNIIQLGRFEFLAPYWDNISDGKTLGFPGRWGCGDGELEPLLGSDCRACFQVRHVKRYPENLLRYPGHPHPLLSFISC